MPYTQMGEYKVFDRDISFQRRMSPSQTNNQCLWSDIHSDGFPSREYRRLRKKQQRRSRKQNRKLNLF